MGALGKEIDRRGFIAAILAAPLAVVGSFAGNHTEAEGAWVEMIASDCHISKPETFKGPTEMWTNIFPGKNWVLIKFGDGGEIVMKQEWHGKSGLPWVSSGDLCDQDKLKGTLLA